jgi:PAS domain S-box-containing protein/putative nucleotidyltransferase with HDIG domain
MEFVLTWLASRYREARRLGPRRVIALAATLFAVVFAVSVTSDQVEAPLVLLNFPIALLAVPFGLRGGLVGAVLAAVLAAAALLATDDGASVLGYVSNYTVFCMVGVLVGRVADQRQELATAVARQWEMSLDPLATLDFEGRFASVNPAWTRILGYPEAEVLTRPFSDFVHPDDLERTQGVAAGLRESGDSLINFRNRYRAKDGSYRLFDWSATTSLTERRFHAVARDITDQNQLEEALARHHEALECAVRDRTRDLEAARLETLQALAYAAEYRDDQTHEHTARVGRAAAQLAEELGLEEEEVTLIRQAAPLHDVGKIGVPDRILLKQGKLTSGEVELMKQHTLLGARILGNSKSPALQLATEISLTHHEWWDGSGYPAGLEGKDIPFPGRIVAIVDVFDALTHPRPYKPAWPVAQAVAEIQSLAGQQFDPAVVDAFERLHPARLLDPLVPAPRRSLTE